MTWNASLYNFLDVQLFIFWKVFSKYIPVILELPRTCWPTQVDDTDATCNFMGQIWT